MLIPFLNAVNFHKRIVTEESGEIHKSSSRPGKKEKNKLKK